MVMIMKYLDLPSGLGGRGGTQRFFMLANGIDVMEELIPLDKWGAEEKARIVESGENPCGTVPVTYTTGTPDGKSTELIQHIATCRYLAKLKKIPQNMTPWEIYVQDLVADEYLGFREVWVGMAFSTDDAEKKDYTDNKVPVYLTKFEALYAKYKNTDTFLSVSKEGNPLWGDAAMYGQLRDNIITGFINAKDLEAKYPNLWAMYDAFSKIDAVKNWEKSSKKVMDA